MDPAKAALEAGLRLLDTAERCQPEKWRALESLVDEGKCKVIGLSNVSLEQVQGIFDAARIKPAIVHVESHPYLPEWDLLNYCRKKSIVLQAFAAGQNSEPKLLEDPFITAIARRVGKTAGFARLGYPAKDGSPDHLEDPRPHQGELCDLDHS